MADASYPDELKYTKDHEWAKKVGAAITIGVTWHAQDALGGIAYIELPKVGAEVKVGGTFGVIESTKSVSDLFSPVAGKVTKVNTALAENPALVNDDPYAAWIIEIDPSNPAEFDGLLSAEAYKTLLDAAK
jgi:glycine cleavage system H protein